MPDDDLSTKRPRKNRPLKKSESCGNAIKRRKISRIRRLVVGSALACFLVVIVVAGRHAVRLAGEWTEIQQITVVGLERVAREEIIKRLALPPHSSLLSFDPDVFSARLESHPWIGSVGFDRVFPHALVVQVFERQPAAILGSSNERYFLDAEGYLLPGRNTKEGAALPIVEGVTSKFMTQNEAEGHRRAKQGIYIAGLLSQQFSGRPRVNVSQPHTTTVDLPDVRFQFGREVEDQWQRFLVLYPTVKKAIEGRSQEVDLRFSQKVIFRKRTL